MAQEKPPKPEPPYPGAETEPNEDIQPDLPPQAEQPLQKTKKGLETEGEIIEGNKFRGTKKTKHPGAKQGLFRITSKGEYLYKTNPSEQKNAVAVRIGPYSPSNLYNAGNDNSFDDIYGSASPVIVHVDYEWKLFSGFGKMGIRAGSGVFFANGNGRFDDGEAALEGYTLLMLPNNVSAIIYLQFWDRQPLIPYAEGGVDAIVFNEYRDDGNPTFGRFGGSLAAHVSLGGLLPLNIFDRLGMIRIDQEYGINNMYISAEYRIVTHVAGVFDFSNNYFNAGVLVEF
ncbi:MAG: hypothetical protein A4S09_05950 [Proteobacteria bacterium SG_bin7]|nr:MAG: hypothetical protein A4S09_05950 [Proteobacteria bacterium SG_bin7]